MKMENNDQGSSFGKKIKFFFCSCFYEKKLFLEAKINFLLESFVSKCYFLDEQCFGQK